MGTRTVSTMIGEAPIGEAPIGEAAAAPGGDLKQQIVDFMTGFTAETTPGSAAKIADYREHLRPGTAVYITFLPGSDFDDTIAVAKRLKAEGFLPVPHFAARSIPDRAFLEDNLRKLRDEVGLKQVLVYDGAGEHQFIIAGADRGASQLNDPVGGALGPNGVVYVLDKGARSVGVFPGMAPSLGQWGWAW